MTTETPPKFDVALSFAAEDRAVARAIATYLRDEHLSVFFDEFATSELWGVNLYETLQQIYSQSKLCILLLSKSYTSREWTATEFRNLLAHSAHRSSFTILPVRLDDAPIPGFGQQVAYVAWSPTVLPMLAEVVKRRLAELPLPAVEAEAPHFHVHVIKHASGGWSVKREGTSRAASVHRSREQAVASAREMALRRSHTAVVIHREDGSIESQMLPPHAKD